MSIWQQAIWYGQYRLRARRARGSAFLRDFTQQVLLAREPIPEQAAIEALRQRLLSDPQVIEFEDLGAGRADQGPGRVRARICDLARRASRSPQEGAFLHRLLRWHRPALMLELGTHLGISTLYQAAAAPGHLLSLEGIPALAQRAEAHLQALGLPAEIRVGSFDELLPQLLAEGLRPGYVFLDGNHRYDATLRYAQQLLPALADGGLLLLDDIYWSPGMKAAWETICSWPEVTCSVDLYRFGLAFVRRPEPKQHWILSSRGAFRR